MFSTRVLVDGAEYLLKSFEGLFERIYYQKTIPGQWLVSKTIPVYKNKGNLFATNFIAKSFGWLTTIDQVSRSNYYLPSIFAGQLLLFLLMIF